MANVVGYSQRLGPIMVDQFASLSGYAHLVANSLEGADLTPG
jgi:hypothetical protein